MLLLSNKPSTNVRSCIAFNITRKFSYSGFLLYEILAQVLRWSRRFSSNDEDNILKLNQEASSFFNFAMYYLDETIFCALSYYFY